jgi:hypothetical protein
LLCKLSIVEVFESREHAEIFPHIVQHINPKPEVQGPGQAGVESAEKANPTK